ncbi:hypothetical protein AC578_1034 [Pseudocercospora eumusae]|uniref:Uncharacterized protein n=1 Tax=Pseudocercospora eumusae TaxID=321146 RepID=A0A139HTP4_9PEZI|nr:hypothetical protein AC578_1034 [Pseudocercospora eumusae]
MSNKDWLQFPRHYIDNWPAEDVSVTRSKNVDSGLSSNKNEITGSSAKEISSTSKRDMRAPKRQNQRGPLQFIPRRNIPPLNPSKASIVLGNGIPSRNASPRMTGARIRGNAIQQALRRGSVRGQELKTGFYGIG